MVEIYAKAEFTADMAETLQRYFDAYATDGVVTIEVTDYGLWLRNPNVASRQFLGRARHAAVQREVDEGDSAPRHVRLLRHQ